MRSLFFFFATTPFLVYGETQEGVLPQPESQRKIISNSITQEPANVKAQEPPKTRRAAQPTYAEDSCLRDLQNKVALLQHQVDQIQEKQNEKVTLSPGRPEVRDGWNIFFTGDFLYWKASENSLQFAYEANPLDPITLYPAEGEIKSPHFNWNYGFRVGAGWNTCHDSWDLFAEWTRIDLSANGHAVFHNSKLIWPTYVDAIMSILPVYSAKEHWHLDFDMIDLELGRTCNLGKAFTLRPHLGLRTAWIDQRINFTYQGRFELDTTSFNKIKYKNDFWGIGIRGGIDSEWELAWGLSIYGDLAFSLLYGNFSINRENSVSTPFIQFKGTTHESLHLARAIADLGIGLRWDYMISDDRYHIRLQAGWEEHIFWGQNQLYNFIDTVALNHGKMMNNNGDLTMQGFTLSARLDF